MKYGYLIDSDGICRAADQEPDGTVWYANGGIVPWPTCEEFVPYGRGRDAPKEAFYGLVP